MENNIIKFNQAKFNPRDNSLTKLTDDALSGMVETLDVYLFLKKLETTVKESIGLLKGGAVDDAIKYGKGEHLVNGTYISVKASAGRWEFSDRVKAAKAEVKRLEEQEKAAYKNDVIMVDNDGIEIPKANFFQGQEVINVKIPKL